MRIDQVHLHRWHVVYVDGELLISAYDGLEGETWLALVDAWNVDLHDYVPAHRMAERQFEKWSGDRGTPPQQFSAVVHLLEEL